jgi:hypothetical protein
MTDFRDRELAAALEALDVPAHRPGFDRRLRRRLAEERLAGGAGDRRRAVRTLRSRALRPVLGAAAAVVALVAIALPLAGRITGAEVASAAVIKTTVRDSLGALRSLSGVFVSSCSERGCPGKEGEVRWRFTLAARGDFRLVGPTDREAVTYDASTGLVRSAQRSASLGGGPLFYAERRGVAPGLPDLGPPTWLLPDTFGAFVGALLAAEDPRVREVEYEGRPAWRLDVDTVPNAIVPEFTGDRFELTVDRGTGLPVRVRELKNGALLRELRVESLAANPALAPDAFRLEFPDGAEVSRSDDGFRRVELDAVAGSVGYTPLVPAWVPEGYELAEVAVARQGSPTGTEAGNPPSRQVVSLSYRRGFDQFVVTTRLADDAGAGSGWSDPLATGEGFVDARETIAISRGALRGAWNELVLAPRGIPHLWAVDDELVTTIAGDLGRAELLRVAESLERR